MKFLYVKRITTHEKRHSTTMGELSINVSYIKIYFLGLPIKTVHKYRQTYYGEIKDCEDCLLIA
jgi:hypothetical protein